MTKGFLTKGILIGLITGIFLTACGSETIPSESGTESEMPMTDTTENSEEKRNATPEGTETLSRENRQVEEKMKIQVGETVFTITLEDNSSVEALKELLADGSLTLNMSDYAGMEKGADLGVTLPENNEQMNTQAGDIILYQGRTFVIYYDTNSWSLTPIGKIENVDVKELREVLGTGDVTVTLFL